MGMGLCSEEMGHQSPGHTQQEILYSFSPCSSGPLLPQRWGAPLLLLAVPSGNNYIVHALNSLFCNDNWMQFPSETHKACEALTLLEAIQ